MAAVIAPRCWGLEMLAEPGCLIKLPQADVQGNTPLERVIAQRRSIRAFTGGHVSLAQLGQLLWAAQGVTHPDGLRTVPSAGALFPLELYAIAAGSDDLAAGIHHYRPRQHGIERVVDGDFRANFAVAALAQVWTAQAGIILIVCATHERTIAKYGERGKRYVAIEAGHCAQDVCLQAAALGLGATEVGAFDDGAVSRLLRLPPAQAPVTSVAVGRPVSASAR